MERGVKLQREFYLREDVVAIAKELLGKYLMTDKSGTVTGGIITETEAYAGVVDKASHAYNNRRTKRTEVMFGKGGTAYVYLCYGIHHLFNVVTGPLESAHAVLIRAVKPIEGIDEMLRRRKAEKLSPNISSGPGTVSQALGIKVSDTGEDLTGNKIWIEDRGLKITEEQISAGPRVGIDYAQEDASLPYRFRIIL
jgi:DNA-3-methyladenine glycosylase